MNISIVPHTINANGKTITKIRNKAAKKVFLTILPRDSFYSLFSRKAPILPPTVKGIKAKRIISRNGVMAPSKSNPIKI